MTRPARIARHRQAAVVGIHALPLSKNIGMTERHAGGSGHPRRARRLRPHRGGRRRDVSLRLENTTEMEMARILGVATLRAFGEVDYGGGQLHAVGQDQFERPYHVVRPVDGMALRTRFWSEKYGWKPEDLGRVAVTQREHARRNSAALMQKPAFASMVPLVVLLGTLDEGVRLLGVSRRRRGSGMSDRWERRRREDGTTRALAIPRPGGNHPPVLDAG